MRQVRVIIILILQMRAKRVWSVPKSTWWDHGTSEPETSWFVHLWVYLDALDCLFCCCCNHRCRSMHISHGASAWMCSSVNLPPCFFFCTFHKGAVGWGRNFLPAEDGWRFYNIYIVCVSCWCCLFCPCDPLKANNPVCKRSLFLALLSFATLAGSIP